MFIRKTKVKGRTYLRLVQSVREGKKVRQINIAYLGSIPSDCVRLVKMANTIIENCLQESQIPADGILLSASEYGRVLVCEKLFKESGLEQFLREKVALSKKPYVSLPHIKAMIYNRLCDPRSKYSLLRWLEDVAIDGIELPDKVTPAEQKRFAEVFYQNMDFLLPYKERIEEMLFNKVKTLFEEDIEVVMYDLTSIYFEGQRPIGLAEYGHPTDGMKGHKQIVLGMVLVNGFPVAHEIFRGNIAHNKTLQEIIHKLQKRYRIKRIVFVADSGLLTKENVEFLEKNNYEYILCGKRGRDKKWDKEFANWEQSAREITEGLRWCEKTVDGKRVILCHSEERQKYEVQMRESIMASVEKRLRHLQKMVEEGHYKDEKVIAKKAERILNRKRAHWYFKYSAGKGKFQWSINEERIAQEKFIEGKFFVWTNNKDMKGSAIILAYKDLWKIERGFRTLKDIVRVRPVFHWTPRRVKSHVFICMLAFFLERLLQRKLEAARKKWSARQVLDSLRTIKQAKVQIGNKIELKTTYPGPIQQKMLEVVGIEKT
jgi:transposase